MDTRVRSRGSRRATWYRRSRISLPPFPPEFQRFVRDIRATRAGGCSLLEGAAGRGETRALRSILRQRGHVCVEVGQVGEGVAERPLGRPGDRPQEVPERRAALRLVERLGRPFLVAHVRDLLDQLAVRVRGLDPNLVERQAALRLDALAVEGVHAVGPVREHLLDGGRRRVAPLLQRLQRERLPDLDVRHEVPGRPVAAADRRRLAELLVGEAAEQLRERSVSLFQRPNGSGGSGLGHGRSITRREGRAGFPPGALARSLTTARSAYGVQSPIGLDVVPWLANQKFAVPAVCDPVDASLQSVTVLVNALLDTRWLFLFPLAISIPSLALPLMALWSAVTTPEVVAVTSSPSCAAPVSRFLLTATVPVA